MGHARTRHPQRHLHGPTEIFGLWRRIAEHSSGGLQPELRDVLANDDRVVALVSVRGRRADRELDAAPGGGVRVRSSCAAIGHTHLGGSAGLRGVLALTLSTQAPRRLRADQSR